MESAGVYWKPVYNPRSWPGAGSIGGRVRRHVMVVNARHMKAAPGRKTDVKSLPRTGYGDAEWIADLLATACLGPASSRTVRSGN